MCPQNTDMKLSLSLLQSLIGQELNNTPSPAGSWLNVRMEHIEKNKAVVSMLVRPEMCNPYGNIHGGMMSLVIDEVIGFAVLSMEAETHYTSINLNVDFLYAIKSGERLKATAEVIRMGKKIMHVEVRVHHFDNNTLLAKATSNLSATSMQYSMV